MKILTVVGARPQFIKASTISRALRSQSNIQEVLVHTGQHYDYGMSEVFFDELDIPQPGYNLGIGSGTHGKQTGEMLSSVEQVLVQEAPDKVMVYGDTNSTLAGALAAAKLHIPIAHVEAGLRSFNRQMPEEINRVLTDHMSDYLFAPTEVAAQQLRQEGIAENIIFSVGDVMYDASLYFAKKAKQHSCILEKFNLQPKEFCLATIHRAENTDSKIRLKNIFDALMHLSKDYSVVLPLHPRTRKELIKLEYFDQVRQSIHLIEPIGYLDMVTLEKNARLILTDSGGIQKEAFFFKTPCIILRDETEWVELLETGWNKLASPNDRRLREIIEKHLSLDVANLSYPPLYGSGKTSNNIVKVLTTS